VNNIDGIFNTNIRIHNLDVLDANAVWPNSIEICIAKIPIRRRDGFSIDMIQQLAAKLKSNMVLNGIVFLVCYAPIECKGRPFEVAKAMSDAGFTHIDNIVVQRSWLPGKRSEMNLVNSHEYVMYFCNGDVWSLDRLPVKEYLNMDSDVTCCGNTWQVETGSLDEAFSLDLAELLIKMTDALPGSLIFSPWMGTSNVMRAAVKNGHSFVGFETDVRKLKQYEKLLKDYERTNKI
jgi:hypothetical protein